MSATMNSTTTYLYTPRGTAVPRTIDQDFLNSDPERNTVVAQVALASNATLPNDDGYAWGALMDIVDAIRDGEGIISLYRNERGIVTSRAIFPTCITVSCKRRVVFKGFCTKRQQVRTFVLDNVLDHHRLILPFEHAA